jgi:hypothetical protein
LNAFTASAAGRLNNIEATTASLNTSVANLNSYTSSQTNLNGTFATTGSNVFKAGQVISGSLVVTGSIFAREIVTTIVSSSVIYASGSNLFGDELTDTQTLSGSVLVRGALKVNDLNYPTSSGVDGYFLQTNGNNQADWNFVRTMYEDVKNGGLTTLPKGTPVFATGSVGNQSIVVAADAGDPNRMPATYVLNETLAADAEGLGIIIGFINGVNTSTFNEGDVIYVGVGGGYTNVQPTGSALIQPLGIVNRVDVNNGSGIVLNPGVSNGLPNITEGYVWIGNADGVPTAVPTASIVTDINTGSLVTTSSFNAYTSSTDSRLGYLESATASFDTSITNLNSFTASADSRLDSLENATSSYVTTGSNSFNGNQTITGSLDVTEVITTQIYLNPQTVTGLLSVPIGYNGMLTGPISNAGDITINSGSTLIIL